MIQYFKNDGHKTIEVDKPEDGVWVNLTPPFKDEEFIEISEDLNVPIEFLRDSLDIDERPRYEVQDNVKLIVIKTPTENNSFNENDAYYITIPICIILTHNHIITVNSFDNGAIKKFLSGLQKRQPEKKNMMVLKILEKVVLNYMDHLKEINQRRYKYELLLRETNKNENLVHLMQLQKSLVYMVAALRSNETLMMKLERTNFLGLNDEERDYLLDLIVETSQALEMAKIYTDIVNSTLNTFASIISNNMNYVVNRLTSIIIILALPVIITIVYVLGFELSAIHSYSFLIPFFLSAVIAVFIGWRIMKKKWF